MTPLFADTSYWVALLNPDDELHSKAAVLAQRFSSASVVTSEMVLVEVLNSFSRRGSHLRQVAGKAVQGDPKNSKPDRNSADLRALPECN